ncbi:MAG TPA: MCE family protein [Pseudonocardiaceae bacterium]|jgi:phospholipid/cholesterol/gamma-HCH transport system substrate-binding protein|nr:MCE family protein [Pseudonocardiaceae bacterium]
MSRRVVRIGLAAMTVGGMVALTGCQGFGGLYGVSLPGGADLGTHPYTVHANFTDVLDLVPQSSVEVNNVPVGKVDSISLNKSDWTAEVTMTVNGDVNLPANSSADLEQSSLLGEKYVQLVAPPDGQGQGRLADGANIPLSRTNRNTEVEEVLGALSMLLNGGGIAQIQTISKELNSATTGNEPEIRALLANVNTLMTNLNSHSSDITTALDGLNRLSATLNTQKTQIAGVLTNLGPGLDVLNSQRDELVTMLQSLTGLSGVAVDTVNKSQADLVADLKSLTPTLQQLSKAGSDLPNALQLLLTFPFTDQAAAGVKGDYENLYASLDLNLGDLLDNVSRSQQNILSGLVPSLQGITGGSTGSTANPPLPLPGSTSGGSGSSGSSGSGGTGGLGSILGTLLGGGS